MSDIPGRYSVDPDGYVRLVSHMGDELTIVNAARVSYAKESVEWTDKDARLLHYLKAHGHDSPFRHVVFTFEIRAPLMVARQWFKYRVGGSHGPEMATYGDEDPSDPLYARNESSRRYVQEDPVFYTPVKWRGKGVGNKQTSAMMVEGFNDWEWTRKLERYQRLGMNLYTDAITNGIAPEQARLFLAAYGMYTTWRWTASLQSVLHFLQQRDKPDAQWEMQQYAKAIRHFVEPLFPTIFGDKNASK